MKKTLMLTLVALVAFTFIAPVAQAREFSNTEKNIGYVLAQPFELAGHGIKAIGKLFQAKPAELLQLPKVARQFSINVLEGTGRTLANDKAIACDKNGSINSWITDNGLDPVVDFAVYGAVGGGCAHNLIDPPLGGGNMLKVWGIAVGSGATVAGMDIAGEALAKK